MGMNWTADQQKVIDTRDCNILVSAAAGSGKTAVLVERIIARLTRDKNPIDVDKLLIVTFTEPAAAEMKERILLAIEKALESDPDNLHLQRQTMLIHNATITTTHSFCLSILNDYFYEIGLNPGYRIADDNEITLLMEDVFDQIIEKKYAEGNENFLEFLESMVDGRSDKKLAEYIMKLYNYSRSFARPNLWLDECVNLYNINSVEEFNDSKIGNVAGVEIAKKVQLAYNQLVEASSLIDKFSIEFKEPKKGLSPMEVFGSQINVCKEIIKLPTILNSYNQLLEQSSVKNITKANFKVGKEGDEYTLEIQAKIQAYVKSAYESLKKINKEYFLISLEDMVCEFKVCKLHVSELIELLYLFHNEFVKTKKSKNLIEFSDMEHYALELLTLEKDGQLIPSKIAMDIQNKFIEIMVDEYQDSNEIQDTIVSMVSKVYNELPQYNIFMVGDVKQSIYGFRQSKPELFMEKLDRYDENGDEVRIDLSQNFRSRSEVLEGCNHVFHKIMQRSLGNVEYDEKARLNVGASFNSVKGVSNHMELLLLDLKGEKSAYNSMEMEARSVAKRIKELIKEHKIIDKKTNEFRELTYSDIVLLGRKGSSMGQVFYKIFLEEGIPLEFEKKEGFYKTWEIGLILEYLKVIDNPKQDTSLAAVLSSMFGQVSSNELMEIKTAFKKKKFHESVFLYANFNEEQKEKYPDFILNLELQTKLQKVLNLVGEMRDFNTYASVYELLLKVLEKTGFTYYVSALASGEQRVANIELLLQKAIDFEHTSYKGVFNFIRYIQRLEKYKKDTGEANLRDGENNIVKYMTIHKSKGLEFPVVFLVGICSGLGNKKGGGYGVMDSELGLGLSYIDTKNRLKSSTIHRELIKNKINLNEKGEELRLLYVAMTRAKEKLILSGVVDDFYKSISKIYGTKGLGEKLSYDELVEGKTYYDWLVPSLCYLKGFDETLSLYPLNTENDDPVMDKIKILKDHPDRMLDLAFDANVILVEDIMEANTAEIVMDFIDKETYMCNKIELLNNGQEKDMEITKNLNFQYRYQEEQDIKRKITVTELKKKQLELAVFEEGVKESDNQMLKSYQNKEATVPLFMKEEKEQEYTGTERGNAFHRFMELWEFKSEASYEQIAKFIDDKVELGYLDKTYVKYLNIEDLLEFLNSSIAKRMMVAAKEQNLFKEQPFVTHLPVSQVYGEVLENSKEYVLLQGIIDVYFLEENEVVILDYKTDGLKSEKEFIERYKVQLDLYANAVEKILEKKVKEKKIYSFRLKKEIFV